MADNQSNDPVIADPTYMADIRFFFTPDDISHMAPKGYDLGTYDGVKANASDIYAHTAPPNPDMPMNAPKWSANRSQTFQNWIINGCPLGTATPPATTTTTPTLPPGARLRKNVTSLSDSEVQALEAAFSGLMARDPSDPNGYFAIAGDHGLPHQWCQHHEDRFNPWHRFYLKLFEDALRSVPGCEDVTLPYWDISTPLPDLLQQPPFASYTLPADPGGGFFPYTTERFSVATIEQNVRDFGVLDDITNSLVQSMWGAYNDGGYQDWSIQAHDSGHGSIGPTMAQQDVASYDPVFWFFHCNIDRLWLSWQTKVGGTTLPGFLSTVSKAHVIFFTNSAFNGLKGFSPATSAETIEFGIAYDELASVSVEEAPLENMVGSIEAARSFSIKRSTPVSVRVKNIDRLNIPGSFVVSLLADDEPIAKRFFFQPEAPRQCDNCKTVPLVNIDFRLDQEELLDRKLSVAIDVPTHKEIDTRFPLSQAGDPTVNARLLLADE